MTSTLQLNDAASMPQIGFGTWQIPNGQAAAAIETALSAGYRSIDTASIYDNERGVGDGLRRAGMPREEVFVTTKLWNDDQGYDTTLAAFDASMTRLGLETLDLYLVHWPAAPRGAYVDTWRAFVRLREEGRIRSIGVSNFTAANLQRIIDETGIVPAVNQIEMHPRFQQVALRDFHAERGIATEAWSPLGRGALLDDPLLVELARTYRKTPAQVVLRWHVDSGVVVIPKSVTPSRIRENIAIADFTLSTADLDRIAMLDRRDGRTGPDPETFA